MSEPPPATTTPHPSPLAPPSSARDYRKGNWTLQETLILISGKRRDDERRAESKLLMNNSALAPSGELRWKWVENYCWSSGCFRSQNQCNDKWDNLLRDYKKVRDHEARWHIEHSHSYWTMEKPERKERNLPTSMAPEIYEALTDAIRRRTELRTANARGGSASRAATLPPPPPPPPAALLALPPPPPPPPTQEPIPMDAAEANSDAAPAPPPVGDPALQGPPVLRHSGTCGEMSESDGDDQVEPEAKRRKIRKATQSMAEGASILARTLLECEERRDKRHRDLMELQERRLRLESERAETNRHGLTTLVSAVTSLSRAIQAVISDGGSRCEDGEGGGVH